MTLTRTDVEEALFNTLGLNKREARELVALFFEELRGALASGRRVSLPGFGCFDLRNKKPRPGRNPTTGEKVPVSARRVVIFRPAKALKNYAAALAGTNDGPHPP